MYYSTLTFVNISYKLSCLYVINNVLLGSVYSLRWVRNIILICLLIAYEVMAG